MPEATSPEPVATHDEATKPEPAEAAPRAPRVIREQPPEGYDTRLCWPPRYAAVWRGKPEYCEWVRWIGDDGGVFEAPEEVEAAMARRDIGSFDRKRYPVTSIPWRMREQARALTGTHTAPVWSDTRWWRGRSQTLRDHFVRVSKGNPGMLAYTQDDGKGMRDIQTPIKVGRYLTRFFSDVLSEKEIAFLVKWQTSGIFETEYTDASKYPLCFAETPRDIVKVYATGPDSCMEGSDCVRVYGAGDLAIAYLRNPEGSDREVLARCLVWPDKKHAGRIYPTPGCWSQDGFTSRGESQAAYDALQNRLKSEGYTFESERTNGFKGARLARNDEGCGSYTMPYLDSSYCVDDDGDWFRMNRNGAIPCGSTDGTIEVEDDRTMCERCEDTCDDDTTSYVYTTVRRGHPAHGETWCDHCASNYSFYCEGFNETLSDDVGSVEVDGCTYAVPYAEANFYRSDRSDDWFDPYHDPSVTMENGDTWSQSEFDADGMTCAATGALVPSDEAHPDHPGVWESADDDAIADYLETFASVAA